MAENDTIELPGGAELARTKVYMLNPNPGEVSAPFADSLMQLTRIDQEYGWDIFQGKFGWISGVNIANPRNQLVKKFLESDGEWAWFCDSDMVFGPDTLVRMLLSAHKANTKILGGLCVMIPQDLKGPIPTIYQFNTSPGAGVTQVQLDYQENSVVQCAATGMGCVLIHRDVFLAMRQLAIDNINWLAEHQTDDGVTDLIQRGMFLEPHPEMCWFNESIRRERWVSEDIEFCLKAGLLGFTIHVDTTIEIGHYKDRRTWMPSDIKRGFGFAKSPITAVVPVKDKLELTQDIVAQLRTQECDEIIVCDNGSAQDTKDWLAAQDDVTVLDCPDDGINTMWNKGATHSLEKHGHRVHVAFLNNDLRLGDDFLKILSRELGNLLPQYVAMSGNYDNRPITDSTVQDTTDICAGRYDGTGGLAGFAFMVAGTLFSSGYLFPERCKYWYGDNDLMQYLRFANFKAGIALLAKVEHLDGGGQTGDWTSPEMLEQIKADERAFKSRWNEFYLLVQGRKQAQGHKCERIVKGERLPFICDIEASVAAFPRQWSDDVPLMVKIKEDVERYEKIIEETKPEVVIECGTWDGGSAEWFASLGLKVITIDIEDHVPADRRERLNGKVHWLTGNSVDDATVEEVKSLIQRESTQVGQGYSVPRTMVSLDSDHHACHVAAEMATYAPLVSPGNYMVVEDGLVRWAPGYDHENLLHHGPMEAIEDYITNNSDFERDEAIEKMHPATMHPAGFLRKVS